MSEDRLRPRVGNGFGGCIKLGRLLPRCSNAVRQHTLRRRLEKNLAVGKTLIVRVMRWKSHGDVASPALMRLPTPSATPSLSSMPQAASIRTRSSARLLAAAVTLLAAAACGGGDAPD